MARTRHYVGPPWPPVDGAYDYARTLCPSDFAWEFLRRSPAYQRDFQLNRKGTGHSARSASAGPLLTRVRRRTTGASAWGLTSFVDPMLPAPSAPVRWCASSAAPTLEAAIDRPREHVPADLCLRQLASARHIVLGPAGEQHVVFKDADVAVLLRLYGARPLLMPVTTTFLLRGLPDPQGVSAALGMFIGLVSHPNDSRHESRDPLLLREAIVALDGRCLGATYREMAAVLCGAEDARVAWSSLNRSMKDRMCRALRKGKSLRDGSYRKLLE